MKRSIKNPKRKNNKIKNKKRYSVKRCYTGGKEMSPKWKQYGFRREDGYLEQTREEMQERERILRREREINRVLINVFIDFIMTLIMNPEQSERFKTYIRENIRITNDATMFNQMIDDFIHFARANLLNDEQILITNRIMDAVQRQQLNRIRRNLEPLGPLEIFDIIERVYRKNL